MSADRAGRPVVVWRSALLPGSETFVRNHGAHLTRWSPAYLGATRITSALSLPTDVIAFPDGKGFLRLRLTGSSPRLTAALRTLNPAVVHAHFGGDGWLVARAAAAVGAPLVVTVHGHDVTRQPNTPGPHGIRYRRNLRDVFRRAAVILAVSSRIRDRAVALGADPAKVRVHHTGIPVPPAQPPASPRWDVAFVGRLVEKKGVADLLSALRRTPASAVVIGDGPLLESLRAQASDLDVTFTGALPPDEVAAHLAAARILAAPSRTAADGDEEGLPTTILEGAAHGIPVVATRHSGIPEAVLDGETGLLSTEGDVPALATNITRLLTDEALRTKFGAAGRTHVAENFDLTKQSARLEDLYDELAGRG
ncbi:glycosyltransferase [Actinoplanes sp. NBRC 103695]|uniref:glycosyltransferase n=1 Tax=Actinoplanes sp. NBRC 103695 TaxID=3032202 RepID=UPI0024A56488|nr:glycosyltransferase [Actinoplanes sp. NBRC 103695]GLY92964.1 glycosyl transferase family 1 [Actinoplanes sp. NBRC 103695]